MPNPMNWPELPQISANDPQAEVKKILLQGQLDQVKANHQAQIDLMKASRDNDYALMQSVYDAYIEVAKGVIERTNASAELVQKAAASIATIYTGVLALSFVVDTTKGTALPARGMAAPLFLGFAIFLATGFRAYISNPPETHEETSSDSILEEQKIRRNTFIRWARSGPLAHRYWLQTAVISLGIGVVLLPLPYVKVDDSLVLVFVLFGLLLTFVLPLVIPILEKWRK